jgi:hypothetical protein
MNPKTCFSLQTKAYKIRGRSLVDEIGRGLTLIREVQKKKKYLLLDKP